MAWLWWLVADVVVEKQPGRSKHGSKSSALGMEKEHIYREI
jgi:hypothetical protein